jgi:hypothetical protein
LPVASAVNYLQVSGAATTTSPFLSALGSDANIHINYLSKGTFGHIFNTGSGSNTQFYVSHTASAVNYLQVTGGATTAGVNFSAQGTDANIFITYDTKGTEAHSFRTNAGAQQQFRIAHTASAVNYLSATGAATGGSPVIRFEGSDTNVSGFYDTKGSGSHQFRTNIGVGAATQFIVANTASAINYLQVTGAASVAPAIRSNGSDANIGFDIFTKGTGAILLRTDRDGTAATQFRAEHTASAVNYLQVTGSASTTPTLSAQGSGADLDISLTPKGTGNVRFGTYTAGAVAQAGYITIKDAAGTTRRLLVG